MALFGSGFDEMDQALLGCDEFGNDTDGYSVLHREEEIKEPVFVVETIRTNGSSEFVETMTFKSRFDAMVIVALINKSIDTTATLKEK